jgi:GNAT superfamily N-acetyltransferase
MVSRRVTRPRRGLRIGVRVEIAAEYVRPAVAGDVDAITALASDRRRRYARYQPAFWRPAANAEEVHRSYLADLVSNDDVLTLVSDHDGTVVGFLIATFGDAPAVYDPGGRTCTIDDFVVAPGRWLTTGVQILRFAIEDAAKRGAIQAVVVTANLDEPKREALRSCGLSIASEWWVTSWPAKTTDADVTQAERTD